MYREYEKKSIQKALDDGRLNPEDLHLVKAFLSQMAAEGNISQTRRMKLATNLMTVHRYLPPISEMKITDIYSSFDDLKHGKRVKDGKPYTKNTIADLSRILKRYLRWLAENQHIRVEPGKVEKIRLPVFQGTKTEEDVLSTEEIQRLIEAPNSARYRAMIAVLYEGGLRIHEIGILRWRDVIFSDWGCRIKTSGKTGKPRTVPIILYRKYLASWKSEHPNPEPDQLVFLNNWNKPLKYQTAAKVLKKIGERAGIQREITPHTLRHTRITHVIRDGLPETHAKKLFWGNLDTDMIKTYAHLTDTDTENALMEMAGIQTDGVKREPSLQPVQCDQCMFINPPGSRLCAQCGRRFTAEVEAEISDVQRAVDIILRDLDNPEVLAVMLQARLEMMQRDGKK
jgi:site-specific recombinase XerD